MRIAITRDLRHDARGQRDGIDAQRQRPPPSDTRISPDEHRGSALSAQRQRPPPSDTSDSPDEHRGITSSTQRQRPKPSDTSDAPDEHSGRSALAPQLVRDGRSQRSSPLDPDTTKSPASQPAS